MNFETIYYFTELAKNLNMSETSERLYISQQTLSNHIKRIEEYYDTKFFFRQPKLMLTPVGEEYLKYAEKLLAKETDIKNKIIDLDKGTTGTLSVGASSPRADIFIPSIIEKFTKKYPKVNLVLHEKQSHELEEMCEENKLDIAISIGEDYENHKLSSRLLLDEKIYLCVSDKLLNKYIKDLRDFKNRNYESVNLKDFKDIPFLLYTQDNRIRSLINNCFYEAGIRPFDYIESAYSRMGLAICNKAIAAVFISQMNINRWKYELNDHINIFPLYSKGKEVTLGIYAIKNKNRYITKYSRDFLALLEEYFQFIQYEQLKRMAKN